MKNKFHVFFCILLLFSCDEQKTEDSKSRTTEEGSSINATNVETPKVKRLNFNWFDFKKNIRFLNCGSSINKEKEYVNFPKDSIGFLYGYCLHNGNQPQKAINTKYKKSEKVIEAITFKNDKEIGLYSDKNEDLLFLKSKINNNNLGSLNIINIEKNELTNKIGFDKINFENFIVFQNQDVLLICKLDNNDKVEWFKYYSRFLKTKEFDIKQMLKW